MGWALARAGSCLKLRVCSGWWGLRPGGLLGALGVRSEHRWASSALATEILIVSVGIFDGKYRQWGSKSELSMGPDLFPTS